jgi:hypothetical protein
MRWSFFFALLIGIANPSFAYAPEAVPQIVETDDQNLLVIPEEIIHLESIRHLSCGVSPNRSLGTGFIYSNHLVITASHVVGNNKMCTDTMTGAKGMIVMNNHADDYAMIFFPDDSIPNLPARIDCNGFVKNHAYMSFGWKHGRDFVAYVQLSRGEKIPLVPLMTRDGPRVYTNMAQLHGTLIQGMSGGPITDVEGKVVGINNITNWNGKIGTLSYSRELQDTSLCPRSVR